MKTPILLVRHKQQAESLRSIIIFNGVHTNEMAPYYLNEFSETLVEQGKSFKSCSKAIELLSLF